MATTSSASSVPLYLCQFAQEHVDFRLQEFEAISKSMKCPVFYKESDYSNKSPFLIISAESEESIQKLLQRSLLIKFIYELWGYGKSYVDLKEYLSNVPECVLNLCKRRDYTFSVRVKGYNKKVSTLYQKERIEWLSFLPINGEVELSNPTYEFHILEDYGDNPNNAPQQPLKIYFGRLLGAGQRFLIDKYSLKTRYFIGNTSMDAQLSLIMANMAQIKPNSLVFDPFAGTGSILVGCAHFGGHVVGGDIDWSLIHGKGKVSRAYAKHQFRGKDDSVRACLRQYGLEGHYIDMLVVDASRSVWRDTELFDAVVTDPPYGVREGPRKVGYRKENAYMQTESEEISDDQPHYPSMCNYNTFDVFTDLVQFAAKYLVTGGHLVYWLPVIKEEYHHSSIPNHPCLTTIATSEQPLSLHVSRYLITMRKTLPWTKEANGDLSKQCSTSLLLEDFRNKYFTNGTAT